MKALSYQEIYLIPHYSGYSSRSEAKVSLHFGGKFFHLPTLPANMECTIDVSMASRMSNAGYFYIMHRFNENKNDPANKDNFDFVVKANKENWRLISISIGVKEEDKNFILSIIKQNLRVDFITIDIAHGHSVKMKEMLEFLNGIKWNKKPFIIAGNIATADAVKDLEEWGADATKVGIAQGDACTTYGQTGFGVPMFTCVSLCGKAAKKPIIADGGIRTNGDFAKALVAGATMVMAGSVFAACSDSPAETVVDEKNKKTYKVYYGSASSRNKSNNTHVEGRIVQLECNGMTYMEKYQEILESLQSANSYSGGEFAGTQWGVR